ncbi:MAG TPA: PP2C family protein-serine/threonine phosphatase [Candidatus Acidoferrales bacterium]|nr:PP2C family protein-serine/threonine phosphatase [Candidatus Acidoferrales bacterium]
MSAAGPAYSTPQGGPAQKGHRVRTFWQRVTEGRQLDQLWGQMKADARATYSFYAHDVDWEAMETGRRWKRPFRICWALFVAMLMKLTPARRVLLLIAIVLMIFHVNAQRGNAWYSFDFSPVGVAILFLLLALELADRVIMKRDLEIARDIQRWLVPEKPPVVPGVDIAFATRPQNTVAGDYYDAFMRPGPEGAAGQVLLMVVADVAGKSVPAALLMATFQASVHSLAARPGSLDELARELNHYACDHSLSGMRFTTAFLAEWDSAARQLRYVNAGHNAPFLRRSSGAVERLAEGGMPFGIDSGADYRSFAVRINPGDLLVIFTDGLAEAVNAPGEEYGEPRLQDRVASFASESSAAALAALMGDVDAFVGQARQHDDITCLAARFS